MQRNRERETLELEKGGWREAGRDRGREGCTVSVYDHGFPLHELSDKTFY